MHHQNENRPADLFKELAAMTAESSDNLLEMPSPSFIPTLSRSVSAMIKKAGWRFSYMGQECPAEIVAANDGFLPLIMWDASNIVKPIWSQQMVVYRPSKDAISSVTIEPIRAILPTSVWLHALHLSLETQVKSHNIKANKNQAQVVPLDKLMDNLKNALRSAKVPLLVSDIYQKKQ